MSPEQATHGEIPRLGTLEARVMDVLWEHGPSTIREVISRLATEPAYTTIATVLANLDRKNLVTSSRAKHSTTYSARQNRHEYTADLMGQILRSSGDRAASILSFVDAMPKDDLELLREYLDRRNDRGRT
ncbi:Transcriptional regulator, MecI family [Actinomycetales bacterium JB111]|nr:Transcriptional regulator, MecI family [Actinomycetales bacterium JB111]